MPTPRTTARTRKPAVVPEEEHPLGHLIPDQSFASREVGGEYVSRLIHGRQDLVVLRYAQRTKPPKNIRLYGPAGPGKTAMAMAYCATERIPLVTINANGGIDPNSFFGQWVPKKGAINPQELQAMVGDLRKSFPKVDEGSLLQTAMDILGRDRFEYVHSDVTIGIGYQDGPVVIFIDEANFLGGKVSAPFHSLTDGRRQITILDNGNEVIKAGPQVMVMIAYNPEYEGTRPLNEAFSDRFDLVAHIDYDRDVEQELVNMPVMLDLADKLREMHKQGEIRTPISTRKLVAFEQFCVDIDLPFACENFIDGFHADEQQAIREILRINMPTLESQVDAMMALVEDDE